MRIVTNLRGSISKIGVFDTLRLLIRKGIKYARYKRMLSQVASSAIVAKWNGKKRIEHVVDSERDLILQRAEEMVQDENYFFTFAYSLQSESPWNYDPLEKKHWPKRHYSESKLHASDTPKDVKIVWEINRFKDLPTLAQAAYLTNDERYSKEAIRRIKSWTHDNPFAQTVNWASGLEIAIRLISWTATIAVLKNSASNSILAEDEDGLIGKSIWQQVTYLANDLSREKVVHTNHLIGEAAGLFVISSFWDFPKSSAYKQLAIEILEQEIVAQTYSDGATREATSWYHKFVTDFFEMCYRLGPESFSETYELRLGKMKGYVRSLTAPDGSLIRYGDADDGAAIYFEGAVGTWWDFVFGVCSALEMDREAYYRRAEQIIFRIDQSFLFLRAGEFGMGGDGFSSHAHDDLLSPIVWLEGEPVLTDPGTFVYNGDKTKRAQYRDAEAHNMVLIEGMNRPRQRMNFGWHRTRPNASILKVQNGFERSIVKAEYGDIKGFTRSCSLLSRELIVEDRFDLEPLVNIEWRFHLDPTWVLKESRLEELEFVSKSGGKLVVLLPDGLRAEIVPYEFSPSYLVQVPAISLVIHSSPRRGSFSFSFIVR